ncbi:MAG: hypothetical protein ACKN9J_01580 [Holophagaceae bacterium]|jgi:ribosomal 50S subunit-recycling heat shock protein
MRLDTFLRNTALITRRDMIHYLCEEGSIRVNGIPRRGMFELCGGETIEFTLFNDQYRVRVLAFPIFKIKTKDQWSYLEIIEKRKVHSEMEFISESTFVQPKTPKSH